MSNSSVLQISCRDSDVRRFPVRQNAIGRQTGTVGDRPANLESGQPSTVNISQCSMRATADERWSLVNSHQECRRLHLYLSRWMRADWRRPHPLEGCPHQKRTLWQESHCSHRSLSPSGHSLQRLLRSQRTETTPWHRPLCPRLRPARQQRAMRNRDSAGPGSRVRFRPGPLSPSVRRVPRVTASGGRTDLRR